MSFNSLLDGCGLSPRSGAYNKAGDLPSGVQADMSVPGVGLIASGISLPVGSVTIEDAGISQSGIASPRSGGNGSVSSSGSNLLDSPMNPAFTPKG